MLTCFDPSADGATDGHMGLASAEFFFFQKYHIVFHGSLVDEVYKQTYNSGGPPFRVSAHTNHQFTNSSPCKAFPVTPCLAKTK